MPGAVRDAAVAVDGSREVNVSQLPSRLPACDTWHTDTPARFAEQKCGRDAQGHYRHRRVCLECQRVKVAEHRLKVRLARGYGVARLSWAPPEQLP